MTWTKISGVRQLKTDDHWLLRWNNNVPVCAVKCRPDHWSCSCLHVGCTSTQTIELPVQLTIEQVQQVCEDYLIIMGWKRSRDEETKAKDGRHKDRRWGSAPARARNKAQPADAELDSEDAG